MLATNAMALEAPAAAASMKFTSVLSDHTHTGRAHYIATGEEDVETLNSLQ